MWVLRTKLVLSKSNRCPQTLSWLSWHGPFFSEVLRLEPRPRHELDKHPTPELCALSLLNTGAQGSGLLHPQVPECNYLVLRKGYAPYVVETRKTFLKFKCDFLGCQFVWFCSART